MKLDDLRDLLGINRNPLTLHEGVISTVGGFLGIFMILVVGYWLLDPRLAVLIVPSMGASAVLLFAAPHVPFSQPWNVLGGHAISALIGVACWRWIPNYTVAASASVGLAIGAMYFARCIHPPGGATALAAVIGSAKLHALGFAYEYMPVLLNTATILAVAVGFNALFRWRRYPAHWTAMAERRRQAPPPAAGYPPINHEDFVYALSQIDTFVDISEEDLVKIYQLATRRHVAREAVRKAQQGS